jgi:hypothetical protein
MGSDDTVILTDEERERILGDEAEDADDDDEDQDSSNDD